MPEAGHINLLDERVFGCANGLWKGKKPPYVAAAVIRSTNFSGGGKLDLSDVVVLPVEERQLASRRLQRGDIVLERSGGGPKQPVGRVAFFERTDGVWSFSNFTSRIRVKDQERFDPRFVFYFLMHFYEGGGTNALQSHTTGIRNLDWRRYRESARIPTLALSEQRRIAALLSAVQRAIEQQEKLIALTAELKKALMHKLFTEGTRREPQKETEVGLIPESWRLSSLGESCDLSTGTTPSTNRPEYYEGKTPFIRTNEIINSRIEATSLFVSDDAMRDCRLKLYPRGTVLVAMYGQGKTRGQVGLLEIPACITQNAGATTPKRELLPEFLFQYLLGQYEQLRNAGMHGQISHLNLGFLARFPVPVPPLEEQQRLADTLNCCDREITNSRTIAKLLSDFFHTLLHELMTGQLRVDHVEMPELKDLGIEVDCSPGGPTPRG